MPLRLYLRKQTSRTGPHVRLVDFASLSGYTLLAQPNSNHDNSAFVQLKWRMPVNHEDMAPAKPLFSVIIPLEAHRGQWERCWHGWNAQTVDRSAYEIIVVVRGDFEDDILLHSIPLDCLEFSSRSHDVDLCAVGAARAHGKYLLFTEAHCWPEPDVLELCLQAIDANPGWAGFSCLPSPVTHNRLSEAEARMYITDIEHALQASRPKNLYQCFVTGREAYEFCGGFKPGLGHFAEWVLAASYSQRSYKIGYFSKAKFHHYYSGSLAELTAFTLNFITGEIRYFDGNGFEPNGTLLEIPPEWICQGNFDRGMARAALHIAIKGLWPPGRSYRYLPWSILRIGRWVFPAIFGDLTVRISASAAAAYAWMVLLLAVVIGPQRRLDYRLRKYVVALITMQRLKTIAMLRRARRHQIRSGYVGFGVDAVTLDATGFYSAESSHGKQFRWSETAATVLVSIPAGPHAIRIDCLPARNLYDTRLDLRFYIDGIRIPPGQLTIEAHQVHIDVNMAQPRIFKLGWTCLPLIAAADPRRLGLPVKLIEQIRREPPADRKGIAKRTRREADLSKREG